MCIIKMAMYFTKSTIQMQKEKNKHTEKEMVEHDKLLIPLDYSGRLVEREDVLSCNYE